MEILMGIPVGDESRQCTRCGKIFMSKMKLKRHMLVHTGNVGRPYRCAYCHKTFPHASILHTHMSIYHGDRPCKCSQCDKEILKVHTREISFKCSQCDISFTQDSDLNVHIRFSHQNQIVENINEVPIVSKNGDTDDLMEPKMEIKEEPIFCEKYDLSETKVEVK
ncbi:unnamed protein product, partial [Meganyctiphanes norvegica]